MAKILISLSGEGRGHATRVRAITQAFRAEHEIILLAPGDAYTFLDPLYAGTEVRVRRIPGLRFTYTATHQLSYRRTLANALGYLHGLPALVRSLRDLIETEQPDLAICDFEPALPRAAVRSGLPWVSVTHQQILRTSDLSSLPRPLRRRARWMSAVVGLYCPRPADTVVSSFYLPSLRRGCDHVTQVGVLLRPEVVATQPRHEPHLLAYFRRFASDRLLVALAASGRTVRIYGLGARPRAGRLTFHTVSESRFIDDLAGCEALVCTAGNQLVGEALFLGKPVFALPEPNNHEQAINAHFLAQSGAGDWADFANVDHVRLRCFLRRREEFRAALPSDRADGLPATLAVLRRHLREGVGEPLTLTPAVA